MSKPFYHKWPAPTETVATSSTAARSAAIAPGRYRGFLTVDGYILQGGSTVTALVTSTFVPAGEFFFEVVSDANNYISAIHDTGLAGKFIYTLIGQ
jgi:hypothetical protein